MFFMQAYLHIMRGHNMFFMQAYLHIMRVHNMFYAGLDAHNEGSQHVFMQA